MIHNNAKIGSQIAKELSSLRSKGHSLNQNNNCNNRTSQEIKGHDLDGRPVVIGASIVDLLAKVNQDEIVVSPSPYKPPGHSIHHLTFQCKPFDPKNTDPDG